MPGEAAVAGLSCDAADGTYVRKHASSLSPAGEKRVSSEGRYAPFHLLADTCPPPAPRTVSGKLCGSSLGLRRRPAPRPRRDQPRPSTLPVTRAVSHACWS